MRQGCPCRVPWRVRDAQLDGNLHELAGVAASNARAEGLHIGRKHERSEGPRRGRLHRRVQLRRCGFRRRLRHGGRENLLQKPTTLALPGG